MCLLWPENGWQIPPKIDLLVMCKRRSSVRTAEYFSVVHRLPTVTEGLFEERNVDEDDDEHMHDQNWRSDAPVKWDLIASGNWIQNGTWNRRVTTLDRDLPHRTPVTTTWTVHFLTREGEGHKAVGKWAKGQDDILEDTEKTPSNECGSFPMRGSPAEVGQTP